MYCSDVPLVGCRFDRSRAERWAGECCWHLDGVHTEHRRAQEKTLLGKSTTGSTTAISFSIHTDRQCGGGDNARGATVASDETRQNLRRRRRRCTWLGAPVCMGREAMLPRTGGAALTQIIVGRGTSVAVSRTKKKARKPCLARPNRGGGGGGDALISLLPVSRSIALSPCLGQVPWAPGKKHCAVPSLQTSPAAAFRSGFPERRGLTRDAPGLHARSTSPATKRRPSTWDPRTLHPTSKAWPAAFGAPQGTCGPVEPGQG